jgi:hypothetical protein
MNAVLVPPQPKIYHIAHVDRLPSFVADGFCGAMRRSSDACRRALPSA